jgi:hypothetical protein
MKKAIEDEEYVVDVYALNIIEVRETKYKIYYSP